MKTEPELFKIGECLYRNHKGIYFALIKVRGKQIKRSLKTDDVQLAKRGLAKFRRNVRGLVAERKAMLFEHLAERWLASRKSELRPNSHTRLVTVLNQVEKFFKGVPVRQIGHSHVEAWKIGRSKELSARSFNYDRLVLHQLFDYAKDSLRIIMENPLEAVKKRREDKQLAEIPSKEQFVSMVRQMRKESKAAEATDLVEFLAYSGMRVGEAREVRWRDINFDLGTVLVTGGDLGTKNHETRIIPLFPPLKNLLEEWRKRGEIGENEKLFNIISAKKAIATACRLAGLPHFGHHAMRHFFCSNAIEAGCDFKVISAWLGHKDGGVLVAKTYGHLRNEHSQAMAQKLTFQMPTPNE